MPEVKVTEDEEAEEIIRRLKTPPPPAPHYDVDFGNGDFTVEMWFYKDMWKIQTKDVK